MWRPATEKDDDVVTKMCRGLHMEDPGPWPVEARQMRATLATLRREPWRGRAVVLAVGRRIVGYALLIAYWSNELGGEVCGIHELFVARGSRGRGHGAALFEAIERGDLWDGPLAGLALGVTQGNTGARLLYQRLGFAAIGVSMVKRCRRRRPRQRRPSRSRARAS